MTYSIERAIRNQVQWSIQTALILFAAIGAVLFLAFLVGTLGGVAGLAGGAALMSLGAVATPGAQPAVMPVIPFTGGSHEHVEGPFATLTVTPTTAVQVLNPIDIPAYGYFRSIWVEVDGAGGAGGTLNADGPWSIIQSISLQDVNGSNIVNPIDGFSLWLINLFSPHMAFNNNPGNYPFYVGTAPNPKFALRVPVEITARDALGSLANQNSAANYRLNVSINSRANMTTADFTTPPVLTLRFWYEGWTLPAAQSMRGEPQTQIPPLLGTGQVQSKVSRSTIVGENTLGITKLGQLLRNVILVGRNPSGVRADACLPDPITLNWDGNSLFKASSRYLQARAFEMLSGAITWPAGVVLIPFAHGGDANNKLGNESPDLWFPTTQSTRLEVVGTVATAGSVDQIVTEIAPIEQTQPERYMVPSDTGRLISPS